METPVERLERLLDEISAMLPEEHRYVHLTLPLNFQGRELLGIKKNDGPYRVRSFSWGGRSWEVERWDSDVLYAQSWPDRKSVEHTTAGSFGNLRYVPSVPIGIAKEQAYEAARKGGLEAARAVSAAGVSEFLSGVELETYLTLLRDGTYPEEARNLAQLLAQ